MKNKKIIILLLFVVSSSSTLFASETAVDGIYYNFDKINLTAKVTYKGAEDDWMYDYSGEEQYTGTLTVPDTVDFEGSTYTVIGFDNDALIGSKLLETLIIPATVTEFGTGVFTYCNSLHTIYIDEKNPVFFMHDSVMYKRNPLSLFFVPRAVSGEVELYNGITTIPSAAFQYRNITNITIPESVIEIKDAAFNKCVYLENITIGNNVKSIRRDAFSYCSSLQQINIPTSVQLIDQLAFSSCENLSEVILNNGIKTIGSYAFAYCSSLASIEIPSSLTLIEDKAFYLCESLKKVTNNSDLDIQIATETHGYVAYYATELIENTLNLDQNIAQNAIGAYCTKEHIVISNAKNQITNIYNILGECIYSAKNISQTTYIPIPKTGIYIVRIDSFSKKLIFKKE